MRRTERARRSGCSMCQAGRRAGQFRSRALHFGRGQSRRQTDSRDPRQPEREPLACPSGQSACRRARRAAVPGVDEHALARGSPERPSIILRRRRWRQLVAFARRAGSEVVRGADMPMSEPAAVSPDGQRIVVMVRRGGFRRLVIMAADGTNMRTLAPSIEIQGAPGQAAADWSPDGSWI